MKSGWGICGCAALVLATSSASAAYLDYSAVPYVYTQSPQTFHNLWQSAEASTVRLGVIGDSQETSPGGSGQVYVPSLGYQFYQQYGNVPETQVAPHQSFGAGSTPAEFLLRGEVASPGPSAGRVGVTYGLPGIGSGYAHSTTNSASNINGQAFGQLTMLQHNGANVASGAALPAGTSFFNPTGTIKAEIFAATNVSSGEIAYRARPTSSTTPGYSAAVTTQGTLSLGLQSPAFAIKSGQTAALNYNGQTSMALEVNGSDDSKLTDIIGLRYVNTSHPQGVVVQDLARSGYSTADFLTNYSNGGALFDALGFHAAVIHYGANDVRQGTSAATFRNNLITLIDRLRTWTGDAQFPVILIADPDRSGLSAAERAEYDQYVGAQYDIAQSDDRVMIVNLRRLLAEQGWEAGTLEFSQYTSDGLHYSPLGARLVAEIEVQAMINLPEPAGWVLLAPAGMWLLRRRRDPARPWH